MVYLQMERFHTFDSVCVCVCECGSFLDHMTQLALENDMRNGAGVDRVCV